MAAPPTATRPQWSKMERKWADAVYNGDKVVVNIKVEWPPGAKRPDGFLVEYQITDAKTGIITPFRQHFPN